MMLTAARRADSPTTSYRFVRLMAALFLVLDVVKGGATGEWAGIEFWVFVLTAEYAATIRNLPPRHSNSDADGPTRRAPVSKARRGVDHS